MTAIAALELHGVAVLMGDFLITTGGAGKSLTLHTRPDSPLPIMAHRVTDMRRKCIIINDHFAVAFTGYVGPGKIMIKALVDAFSAKKRAPHIAEIDDVLAEFTKLNTINTIIGWTVPNRKPLCFSFTTKRGEKVCRMPSTVAGTGSKSLRKYISGVRSGEYGYLKTASERAISNGLAAVGYAITEEIISGQPLTEAFGGGAEIAVWDGKRFKFIPKIGFFFWNLTIGNDHRVTAAPSRLELIYENKGEWALFASFVKRPGGPANVGTEIGAAYLAGMLPLYKELPLKLGDADTPSHDCPFLMLGFTINFEDNQLPPRVIVFAGANDSGSPLTITTNDDFVNLALKKSAVLEAVRSIDPEAMWC
jgi:hypothetical protein